MYTVVPGHSDRVTDRAAARLAERAVEMGMPVFASRANAVDFARGIKQACGVPSIVAEFKASTLRIVHLRTGKQDDVLPGAWFRDEGEAWKCAKRLNDILAAGVESESIRAAD